MRPYVLGIEGEQLNLGPVRATGWLKKPAKASSGLPALNNSS